MTEADTSKVEPIFDESKLGTVLSETEITVDGDALIRYAKAIGETDPKYVEKGPDLVAHPGMVTVFQAQRGQVDIKFPFAKTSMHGGSAIFTYAPIHAGDKLKVTSKLANVYTKTGRSGPMGFVVHENEFINQEGVVVAKIQDSMVTRP